MRAIYVASTAILLLGAGVGIPSVHAQSAPRLPVESQDGSVNQFLMQAKADLAKNRAGAAQEALERAETRLLDRSTEAGGSQMADASPRVGHVRDALTALGHKDRAGASKAIDMAMSDDATAGSMPQATSAATGQGGSAGMGTAAHAAPMAMTPVAAPTTASGSTTAMPAPSAPAAGTAAAAGLGQGTAATTASGSSTPTPAYSGPKPGSTATAAPAQ